MKATPDSYSIRGLDRALANIAFNIMLNADQSLRDQARYANGCQNGVMRAPSIVFQYWHLAPTGAMSLSSATGVFSFFVLTTATGSLRFRSMNNQAVDRFRR